MYFDNIHSLLPMPSPFRLPVLPNASQLISFVKKNYRTDCASCHTTMCMTREALSQLSQCSSYQLPVAPQLQIGSVSQTFFTHPCCKFGWLDDEQGLLRLWVNKPTLSHPHETTSKQSNSFTYILSLFCDASCSYHKVVWYISICTAFLSHRFNQRYKKYIFADWSNNVSDFSHIKSNN